MPAGTTTLDEIEAGTTIGYVPVGADDARAIGIVQEVTEIDVIVSPPDDPETEERVPFDYIEAVEPPT